MDNVYASSGEWTDLCRSAYAAWVRTEMHPLCPVIVGQAGANRAGIRHGTAMFPNPRTSAGYRLFKMTGLSLTDYVTGFERFNTITRFPGQSGRGHKFPLREARLCAHMHMLTRRMTNRPCVIIGKANAQAYWRVMGRPPPDPLEWDTVGHGSWAWMPHTSGIVQFWNQPGNPERVAELFADLSDYVPGDNS